MLDRPDAPALLEAVARFLLEEVHGAVADQRLAFRVLVAAHLSSTLAEQLRAGDAVDRAEGDRLRALLPDAPAPEDLREALRRLNRELARRIRERALTPDALSRARDHLRRTLLDALAIASPRFDTSSEIE